MVKHLIIKVSWKILFYVWKKGYAIGKDKTSYEYCEYWCKNWRTLGRHRQTVAGYISKLAADKTGHFLHAF